MLMKIWLTFIYIEIGADKDKPDWKAVKDFLLKEGPMKKEQVVKLLRDGIAMMSIFLHI